MPIEAMPMTAEMMKDFILARIGIVYVSDPANYKLATLIKMTERDSAKSCLGKQDWW